MSKNIFATLNVHDSDDEVEQKKKVGVGAVAAKKPVKKELRAADQQLRQQYGDTAVPKDDRPKPNYVNPMKNKGDYAPYEKRPFDRRSGTGQPAFTKDFKKGGHGKGNVGSLATNARSENTGDAVDSAEQPESEDNSKNVDGPAQATNPPQEEKQEEIILLEDYVNQRATQFGFLKQQENQVKNSQPAKSDDPNLKVTPQRQKDEQVYSKKAKNPDNLIKNTSSVLEKNVTLDSQDSNYKRYGNENAQRERKTDVVYNEQNFPTLG